MDVVEVGVGAFYGGGGEGHVFVAEGEVTAECAGVGEREAYCDAADKFALIHVGVQVVEPYASFNFEV